MVEAELHHRGITIAKNKQKVILHVPEMRIHSVSFRREVRITCETVTRFLVLRESEDKVDDDGRYEYVSPIYKNQR